MRNEATGHKLRSPDPTSLAKVEEFCHIAEPYQHIGRFDRLFVEAMQESLLWHQKKSPFYNSYLSSRNFDIQKWDGDISKIPFLVADFFKQHEVKSISDDEIALHLTSSGTTGQKSQIFFDKWSIGIAQQMVDSIFKFNRWNDSEPTNYLLYSYQPQEGSKLGTAYTDNFLTKYAPVNRVEYALKWNGKSGHDFDPYGCIRALQEFEQEEKPVRIFGFPAFLYFTLQKIQDLGIKNLKLNLKSFVFLGGGWKGNADKAIDKKNFYALTEEVLGIPNERLRDGYGSVEHCVPYVECKNHRFHVPVWSKVVIRDLRTLESLTSGEQGFLQFISPYITSVPAISVMMGDLAVLHEANTCDCGLNTQWFEILGRAGISKNKSCAIAAAELLRSFS